MPQVRALTKVFHAGVLYQAGEKIEFTEEEAGRLSGKPEENVVLVTKKSESVYQKEQQAVRDELEAKARALHLAYEELKAQLDSDPTRGDLVQQVLDAEIASKSASDALAEFDTKAAEQAAG